MKEAILNYFKTDRSHASGAALVIRFSAKMALKRQVNIYPQNDAFTGIIHEELREMAGISRNDLHEMFQKPISLCEIKQPLVLEPEQQESPAGEKKASRKK